MLFVWRCCLLLYSVLWLVVAAVVNVGCRCSCLMLPVVLVGCCVLSLCVVVVARRCCLLIVACCC